MLLKLKDLEISFSNHGSLTSIIAICSVVVIALMVIMLIVDIIPLLEAIISLLRLIIPFLEMIISRLLIELENNFLLSVTWL